jgi:predicted polyphosphate/ATP-dependent NAD kinase
MTEDTTGGGGPIGGRPTPGGGWPPPPPPPPPTTVGRRPTVGLIANPAAGKDIRRLVAHGSNTDTEAKIHIVRRVLLGLASVGIERVLFMPDHQRIVERALAGIHQKGLLPREAVELESDLVGEATDTEDACRQMVMEGADCIVVLGGDGTNRAAAKACGDIPLVSIATGTNNVFARSMEGTVAGLAAGVVANGMVKGPPAVRRTKRLVVLKNGTPVDMALVDAVVLDEVLFGARAVWGVDRIRQVVVTTAEPDSIGLSAIAGSIVPIGRFAPKGLAVDVGNGGIEVKAPIAPGVIASVPVSSHRVLEIGAEVEVRDKPSVIALDGEREVYVGSSDTAAIRLEFTGPMVVDVRQALRRAIKLGYSVSAV